MSPLRQRNRALVALGLVGLIAAGCVKQGPPGVAISPLKADIVFGVKEATPVAAPANFVAPIAGSTSDLVDEVTVAQKFEDVPDFTPLPNRPSAPTLREPPPACPPAALTAFPALGADSYVRGLPAEGVYRFKQQVTVKPPNRDPFSYEGYSSIAVRRVVQNPSKSYEFSFQTVEPSPVFNGVTVTSFVVNSNPAVVRNVNQAPQTIGVVPTPGVDQTITPPTDEPGMFLTGVENQSYEGDVMPGPFRPTGKGVKYLPLDESIVKPGQTFDSVGIDTTNQQALRNNGTVLRKTRIDACGEIVEGWLVEATQSFSTEPLLDRKVFYNIATQYGALFIAKSTEFTADDGNRWTIELSLASLKPSPLPEKLK